MQYYVYFDAYGHAGQVITERELTEQFNGDPEKFLKAMCAGQLDAAPEHCSGHVGTLSFATEAELKEYLDTLGEEITGFYGCRSDSRPYNF